ncbi:hypothetical protein F2Q69_00057623 [Brassica cretica]|uniref:Uncharacterized protein n=1 Tax=Brassica cretica TaxID=69181 RepID=A0A8S9MUI5_BRACR|nr:hypothetical protein F2Q69_00057623 [Brassica cretica]
MFGVLFQYYTYRGVDDWLLTLGPCRSFFGGGCRLSYSRKCSSALQSSVVCVVTAESPKPSITVGGGFSVDVVKFPVVFRWSNDLVCSGLSMKTVEAHVPV